MIAAWILYCALWTLWLSAVAWGSERLILTARGPVRVVWISAMMLSVVGPIVGYSLPRESVTAPPAGVQSSQPSIGRAEFIMRTAAPAQHAQTMVTLRTIAARADRSLSMFWIVSSLLFLAYIAGGVLRLRIVRRGWRTDIVDGTPVMISENTGPALVGVFDTAIVIPAWALELQPNALALMLRHECEHRAAGDTRTLAVAQALLALMPWNPLMWWQLRRLRLAIEIDCDARVLRHTNDVATYGRLLLEFGRERRGTGSVGAALADHHASQLETRIRRLTRRAPTHRVRVIATSLVAVVVAIAIGCQLPTPPAPEPRSNTPGDDLAPLFARLDSSIAPSDSAGRAAARTLRAHLDSSAILDRERERRISETARALARAEAKNRFESSDHWSDVLGRSDSAAKKLFEAQIGLVEARDSASRRLWQTQVGDAKHVFDSLVARHTVGRFPMDWPRQDSLQWEIARLRATLTDEHPQIERLLAELQQERSLSDSALALGGPGCGVDGKQPGKPSIKFIVSESDLSRLDKVEFVVAESTSPGAALETRGLSCSTAVQGQIKYFGYGAYHSAITIRTNPETSLIVVTGSGRVLAGPVVIKNEARRYEVPLRR